MGSQGTKHNAKEMGNMELSRRNFLVGAASAGVLGAMAGADRMRAAGVVRVG